MIPELQYALESAPYSLTQSAKEGLLLKGLSALTQLHYDKCEPYRRIIDGLWRGRTSFDTINDIPYLPVSLFKMQDLRSVDSDKVRVTLTSSGTTGQAVSRIFMDADASMIQQKALANSLMYVLGKQRLPMLVIDTPDVFKNPKLMNARGAGVLGIMRYGRNHVFALNSDLSPNFEAIEEFLRDIDGKPFFMFGFTYIVWLNFHQALKDRGLDLSQAVLIHSGGWKKMIEMAVDNSVFRQSFAQNFNLTRIHNFYGMVEQIGSIFLEGEDGLLFPPNFTDVIVRDPVSWEPLPHGEQGVIQVLSLLPHSYPGHSLLTEDMGVVEAVDVNSRWAGKGIRIKGRVAKSELRGCSDIVAAAA